MVSMHKLKIYELSVRELKYLKNISEDNIIMHYSMYIHGVNMEYIMMHLDMMKKM
jgi:hypothetical protein